MTTPTDFALRAEDFIRRQALLPEGTAVLCALSGGADSMALLAVLLELAPRHRWTVLAAHYNHRLRGEEARRDQVFTETWCRKLGVPLTVGSGDVAQAARAAGAGLEETARAMRYAFLQQAAEAAGVDFIATAHNADDNAETVLLHLIRGTGLDGLTGIPPQRGNIVRPLLALPRADIEAYLTRQGLPHVEDSSNQNPAFSRNRLRQEVLPVCRAINPGFTATLADNLVHLRLDRDFLRDQALPWARQAVPCPGGLSLPVTALTQPPRPVAVRVVRLTLETLRRYRLSAVHLDAILALAGSNRPGGSLALPRGLTVRREYDRLRFLVGEPSRPPGFAPVTVTGPGLFPLDSGWQAELALAPAEPDQGPYLCYLRRVPFPLTLRPRVTGDRLALPGRPRKTLKKWCIDEKIPQALRADLPVLADSRDLLAAGGLGPDARFCARPGEPALRVRFITPQIPKDNDTMERT